MANLLQELVNEILLWLPVKSLLRFKCVSKSFCAIIESQYFINSHFKRSSSNSIHRKLIDLGLDKTDNNCWKIHALAFNDDFQQELVLEKPIISDLYNFFCSYCNGLVLLCPGKRVSKLSIWNPSTRKYRILPTFPLKKPRTLSYGLGYDSTSDDYKAVVIVSKKLWNATQVWIFELRSSCWRRIQDFPYRESYGFQDGGNGDCFVDGAMHFVCDEGNFASHMIVAFDVAKETFSIVSEPVYPIEAFPPRLFVFGGCLSICFWSLTEEMRVDTYVRKKEGVGFTWTKFYSVTEQKFPNEVFDFFAEGRVAYSKEGDKVFVSSNRKLCSYDLEEKTLQEIVTKNTHHMDIFSCIESLVSIGS